jgi:5'-nucleotidase
VLTVTGAQIKTLLEQQWQPANTIRFLQISSSLSYSWSQSAPQGARIDPASIKIDGVVVDPSASYRVVTNSFLQTGGDGFAEFTNAKMPFTAAIDVDALVSYFQKHDPLVPPALNRITSLP